MKDDKKFQYDKLSKQQQQMVEALEKLGFIWKYYNYYELLGWGVINISKIHNWAQLLKLVHEQGKDQKRFEFQRVLGID